MTQQYVIVETLLYFRVMSQPASVTSQSGCDPTGFSWQLITDKVEVIQFQHHIPSAQFSVGCAHISVRPWNILWLEPVNEQPHFKDSMRAALLAFCVTGLYCGYTTLAGIPTQQLDRVQSYQMQWQEGMNMCLHCFKIGTSCEFRSVSSFILLFLSTTACPVQLLTQYVAHDQQRVAYIGIGSCFWLHRHCHCKFRGQVSYYCRQYL